MTIPRKPGAKGAVQFPQIPSTGAWICARRVNWQELKQSRGKRMGVAQAGETVLPSSQLLSLLPSFDLLPALPVGKGQPETQRAKESVL